MAASKHVPTDGFGIEVRLDHARSMPKRRGRGNPSVWIGTQKQLNRAFLTRAMDHEYLVAIVADGVVDDLAITTFVRWADAMKHAGIVEA